MLRRAFSTFITRDEFVKSGAWGLATSVDVKQCCPDTIRNADKIRQYSEELCKLIDMKRFGQPMVVHFGEDKRVAGYSLVQLLMTSNLSGHFANETNTSYIDIFSCKWYDAKQVEKFTVDFFKGKDATVNVLLRK